VPWSRAAILTAAALLCVHARLTGQAQFDVASVKENTSGHAGGTIRFSPDGGIRAQNVSVGSLITTAYGLQPFQLAGAPGWTQNARFDVNARPAAAVSRPQSLEMLQGLLVERFRLTAHRENRAFDGFALLRASDARLGPGLRPSTVDCEAAFDSTPRCRDGRIAFAGAENTMTAVGAPIQRVVQLAVGYMRAPVIDQTRLAGPFDIDLRWTDELVPSGDVPALPTALLEQLGLKLDRRPVSSEVFVVDRIERPEPD
jgi:uncharacterized protein (TIGR03435 family)